MALLCNCSWKKCMWYWCCFEKDNHTC